MRWGAVFSGAVVGLGVFVLLTALWLALAYGSGIRWWQSSLNWWVGATGILAMFVAGLLSGYLSGACGIVAGLANSVTVWGLATLAIVLSGVPVGLGLLRAVRRALAVPSSSLWTVFWSLLIGLGAVAIGGMWAARLGAGPGSMSSRVLSRRHERGYREEAVAAGRASWSSSAGGLAAGTAG